MNNKNKWMNLVLITLLGLMFALTGCSGASEPETAVAPENDGPVAATLTDAYDDALSVRNQLLLGTLRLEGGETAVNPEQAKELLVLWQAFNTLSSSGTAAPEETEAVQNQIIEAMTPAQIQAIAAMQLTNADLQTFYVEAGLSEIKTPEPGVTPQSGSMRDLSQEDRESTRAASGMEVGESSGAGSRKSDVLMDMVLELLAGK
jgi:hypothetical protein